MSDERPFVLKWRNSLLARSRQHRLRPSSSSTPSTSVKTRSLHPRFSPCSPATSTRSPSSSSSSPADPNLAFDPGSGWSYFDLTDVLRLHEVERSSVDSDIKLFLKTQLTEIIKNRSNCDFAGDWPSQQNIDALCKKAAGFFIYASTVIKFVSSQYHPPGKRLAVIISLPQDTSHEGKSGVDLLYTQVLQQASNDMGQDFYSHFKLVVGAVLLIFRPLSINTLSDLLGNCGTPSKIYSTLRTLHSLLLIPDSMEDSARIFHKSFPDFLMDPGRCTDQQFFIDPSIYHREILLSCLNVMKGRLKRNICELDDHVLLSEVGDLSI